MSTEPDHRPIAPSRDLVADAARALRESMPAGALAMMAAQFATPVVRGHYERVNAVQAAAMRALVLATNPADPAAVQRVADEAARRAALMGDLAAWESVTDDLTHARWRP